MENRLLNNHLLFEFSESGYSDKGTLLMESFGAVTNIRYYLGVIQKRFIESENNTVVLTDKDFPLGDIKPLEVKISFTENISKRPNAHGYYSYENGTMTIHIKAESYDKDSALNGIRRVFGHELIHAVHENGLKQTYNDNSATINDFEPFYSGALHFLQNGDFLEREFGYVLYHLADSEKNAFIGQAFTDLEPFSETIIDAESAKKAILSTETYQRLMHLEEKIKRLKTLPEADKSYLTMAFNRFTGKEYTFEKMLAWMDFRYNRFLSKFFEQASKMANFYYEENLKKKSKI